MTLRVSIPQIDVLGAALKAAVREVAFEVAREMPEHICRQLRQGNKPDGTPQPANAASTLESKRARGRPPVPGVDEGVLSDPRRWIVRDRGRDIAIEPPLERLEVVEILRARGYEFEGVPAESTKQLEKLLSEALKRAVQLGSRRAR